jgi:hypothetical protein
MTHADPARVRTLLSRGDLLGAEAAGQELLQKFSRAEVLERRTLSFSNWIGACTEPHAPSGLAVCVSLRKTLSRQGGHPVNAD